MLTSVAINHLKHVLGRDPSPRLDLYSMINHAGQVLCGMRRWNWMVRPPVLLTMVGGREYVALPADFTSIISIEISSAVGGRMDPAELSQITLRRSQTSTNQDTGLYYQYAVSSKQAPESNKGSPTWQLELWPTPINAGSLLLNYAGGWRQVYGAASSEINSDANHLPIRDYCEPLYLEILNCIALGRQRPEKGTTDERLAKVINGLVAISAIQMDGSSQQNIGKFRQSNPDLSHIKDQLPVRIS